jgi:hypothetical protein
MEKGISVIKKSGNLSARYLLETIGCQASEFFLVRIDVSYKMPNSLGQDSLVILEPCGSLYTLSNDGACSNYQRFINSRFGYTHCTAGGSCMIL